MFPKKSYPVFLDLKDRRCLIAGFGKVGQRKLAGLLDGGTGPILVLDLRPRSCFADEAALLLHNERVSFQERRCEKADILQSFLVFAATGDRLENLRIAAICRAEGVLCNCVTEPAAGDFMLPMVARRHGLCAAFSTGGASPALARQCRMELETWLGNKAKMAWFLGRIRPLILDMGMSQTDNAAFFHKILASPLGLWLAENDLPKCEKWLETELPGLEHEKLAKILTEYANAFSQ